MNPVQIIVHFDYFPDAPDAVPRLRRFILDLAVRGKLVKQDPKDEPASELLKRILAEKSRLVKAGEIPRLDTFAKIDADSLPFSLPTQWAWTQLGKVIHLVGGQHLQPGEYSEDKACGPPYITGPADFGENGLVISRYAIVQKAFAKKDQILLTVKGAGVGKTAICNLPIVAISRQLMAITPIQWHAGFLILVTDRLAESLKAAARSLIPGISRDDVEDFVFALPPLAEQHRIVAKVDELMALCDRLEAAQAERESRRDRLVRVSLHRLNEPGNAETIQDHTRFTLDYLPRLTTRPEHITQLRQTILNLAVRGKLVPQDPKDEPVSELLKRIQAEKARLGKSGKIKRIESYPAVSLDERWCAIPSSWVYARLGALTNVVMGTSPPGSTYNTAGDGVPLINGPVEFTGGPFGKTTVNQYTTEPTNFCESGDFLICVRGSTTGRTNIAAFHGCIGRGVAAIQPIYEDHYVRLCVCSRRQSIIEMGRGIAFPSISRSQLENIVIPLPPLPEQHRIVAKVGELMALCDRLETQLTTGQAESRRLLEAVLYEALATQDSNVPESHRTEG